MPTLEQVILQGESISCSLGLAPSERGTNFQDLARSVLSHRQDLRIAGLEYHGRHPVKCHCFTRLAHSTEFCLPMWLTYLILAVFVLSAFRPPTASAAPYGIRHRVLVSTDIGGTDPDDDQSLVHLLLYADQLDLEGLVSSPYGPGRMKDILEVIEVYEQDYPNLKRHSARYPAPDTLRQITRQGAIESPGASGIGKRTEGSDWIITCARREDLRPLHVLVWGGIEDLAQALHDAPDILPKLRVYFVGGPNKMWSVDAYHSIEQQHPGVWMIEANSTYRGWFVGGDAAGEWSNQGFVSRHVAGHGALGNYFAALLKGSMKMGDSPSVGWLLRGDPSDPSKPGWGGQFVRVWDGRTTRFDRLTTEFDTVDAFGMVEFALPRPADFSKEHTATMILDQRIRAQALPEGDVLRFRFSPRDAKVWRYLIQSDCAELNGHLGAFTAKLPLLERARLVSKRHPHWWTDDPDPSVFEGVHPGAKSVNRWRLDFLRDFAVRMDRCLPVAKLEPSATEDR